MEGEPGRFSHVIDVMHKVVSILVSFPDPRVHPPEIGSGDTFNGFPGLTGYVNCVWLCNSHVLKRSYLIFMHALYTIHVRMYIVYTYNYWQSSRSVFLEAIWAHMIFPS